MPDRTNKTRAKECVHSDTAVSRDRRDRLATKKKEYQELMEKAACLRREIMAEEAAISQVDVSQSRGQVATGAKEAGPTSMQRQECPQEVQQPSVPKQKEKSPHGANKGGRRDRLPRPINEQAWSHDREELTVQLQSARATAELNGKHGRARKFRLFELALRRPDVSTCGVFRGLTDRQACRFGSRRNCPFQHHGRCKLRHCTEVLCACCTVDAASKVMSPEQETVASAAIGAGAAQAPIWSPPIRSDPG